MQIILFLLSFFPLCSLAAFPKRGLSFNNPHKYIQNWNDKGSQVNWAYNWDSAMESPGATFPEYLEFVPMLWGTSTDHTGNVSLPLRCPHEKPNTKSSSSPTPTQHSPTVPDTSSPSTNPMAAAKANPASLRKPPSARTSRHQRPKRPALAPGIHIRVQRVQDRFRANPLVWLCYRRSRVLQLSRASA
jgi:hypothetical protein